MLYGSLFTDLLPKKTTYCLAHLTSSKLTYANLPIGQPESKSLVQSELFENKIGPGELQSSVQKTCVLSKAKAKAVDHMSVMSFSSEIIAGKRLLNARLEHSRLSSLSKYVIILLSECSIGKLQLAMASFPNISK